MIVWLASYLRSGNTLLRNILKKTMGLDSYSQHGMPKKLTQEHIQDYGILQYKGKWETFYHRATQSNKIFLVKTHFLPFDNQPVIHVVRDGRLATESYLIKYQERAKRWPGIDEFTPEFYDLLIGRDYYSDWTDHFRAWEKRENASRLFLRYEEIVDPSAKTLQKIASFVGYTSEPKPFENRRTKQIPDSGEVRGKSYWSKPEHRTLEEEALFNVLHADLMLELGYLTKTELEQAKLLVDDSKVALGRAAQSAARERYQAMFMAMEKESKIQQLINTNLVSLALSKVKQVLSKQ